MQYCSRCFAGGTQEVQERKGFFQRKLLSSGPGLNMKHDKAGNPLQLLKPLCCWWLIWPIQNNAENLNND